MLYYSSVYILYVEHLLTFFSSTLASELSETWFVFYGVNEDVLAEVCRVFGHIVGFRLCTATRYPKRDVLMCEFAPESIVNICKQVWAPKSAEVKA